MIVRTENGAHHITWPAHEVPTSTYLRAYKYFDQSRDYSIRLAQLPRIDLGTDQIISVRNAVMKNKIIHSHSRMDRVIAVMIELYNNGANILDLSNKYDFSPLTLLRKILLAKYDHGMVSDIFANRNRKALRQFTPHDRRQFIRAEKHDAESAANQADIARIAAENEIRFVQYLKSLGIKLYTQDDLVAQQMNEYGRAISTPDVLFIDTVYINGARIYWIDYKDYIGTTVQFLYESNTKQSAKYLAKWGPGAFCYRHGYVRGLNIPGAVPLDGQSLRIKFVS